MIMVCLLLMMTPGGAFLQALGAQIFLFFACGGSVGG